ncbi:metal-dependent hydrolase [Massilia sp. B-10]|nr:metal-dependent hydrolase [Massilia sp. B-10]
MKSGKIKLEDAADTRTNILKLGMKRIDCYINDRISIRLTQNELVREGWLRSGPLAVESAVIIARTWLPQLHRPRPGPLPVQDRFRQAVRRRRLRHEAQWRDRTHRARIFQGSLVAMPTILTHPAVPLMLGLALGPALVPRRLLLAGVAASILPDLDVIGFRLGISYGQELGHRGVSHALVFALLLGLIALAMAPWLRARRDGLRVRGGRRRLARLARHVHQRRARRRAAVAVERGAPVLPPPSDPGLAV